MKLRKICLFYDLLYLRGTKWVGFYPSRGTSNSKEFELNVLNLHKNGCKNIYTLKSYRISLSLF
jgi:hypothetical protein